jgi:hypothetical protein
MVRVVGMHCDHDDNIHMKKEILTNKLLLANTLTTIMYTILLLPPLLIRNQVLMSQQMICLIIRIRYYYMFVCVVTFQPQDNQVKSSQTQSHSFNEIGMV